MGSHAGNSSWESEELHSVKALINYPPPEKQEYGSEDLKISKPLSDFFESSKYMTIDNARGKEDSFNLEKNGFQIVTLPEKTRDVSTDDSVRATYYPEVEELIKKLTGATSVFQRSHILRRTENKFYQEGRPDTQRYNRYSAAWPHTDYPITHPERFKLVQQWAIDHFPHATQAQKDEIHQVAQRAKRFAVVQTWRPLSTLVRDPLAMVDATTVQHLDWRFRRSEGIQGPSGGIALLTHPVVQEEVHRWYYLHEMKENEMYVFLGLDTRQGEPGYTGYVGGHTPFVLPEQDDKPARESIETRALCFWD